MRKVRKLRHWKQRFDKNAAFIWRKPVFWMGEEVKVADPIPEELANTPNKLRRFWESGIIELAEFEEPNVVSGRVEPKVEPTQTLIGHDDWPAEVQVGDETVQLGDVVQAAFEASELTVEQWNELSDEDRADRLQVALGEMQPEPEPSEDDETDGDADQATAIEPVDPETLVTKETDRKWLVAGLDEVFKSKTKALEAAQAMIAEQSSTEDADEADTDETEQPDADADQSESSDDDAWLEGEGETKED